jgi:hypothetical protein
LILILREFKTTTKELKLIDNAAKSGIINPAAAIGIVIVL